MTEIYLLHALMQVADKQDALRLLEKQREQLHSAQSDRQSRSSTTADDEGARQLLQQLQKVNLYENAQYEVL